MSYWYILAAITVLVAITIACYLLFSSTNIEKDDAATMKTYFRFSEDLSNVKSLEPIETFKNALTEFGYKEGEKETSCMYMFETLNIIDILMDHAKFGANTKFILGMKGTDEIVSKSSLALNTRIQMDAQTAFHMLPLTFIYEMETDMKLLERDLATYDGMYIMKKNIQRQEGNLITRDPKLILNGAKDDYVVVQRLLMNPYIVGGRKINMRVYMLVVASPDNSVNFYIYNNGFMYYSPSMWDPSSFDPKVHITTGYIDRQVYVDNPLTFEDLERHIGAEQYSILWTNILNMMSNVRKTYAQKLSEMNKKYPGTKFLIHGCDIAPDENLNVKLIEINKGPDLSYKDERDKYVKLNMVKNALRLVGMGDAKDSQKEGRFIQV